MAATGRFRRIAASLALGLAGLVLPALAGAGPARAEGVALTFDDVPGLSLTDEIGYWRRTNAELIRALRVRRMPAAAFVIGDKLEDPDRPAKYQLVREWRDAGFMLGNHTYSHGSLNRTPVADYIADTARDDALLRPLLARRGEAPRWFRHPYLETGRTLEDKRAFEAWLAAHGYRVAPVTAENSDWMFALPYDEAVLKKDRREARRIQLAYLDYTEKAVAWYRVAALELLGRRPDLVLLLHDTRLNADSLGALAAILKKQHLRVVSLDRAMADPAYRISDDFADPDGDEWLSRWSVTLKRPLPWDSFPEPPADIAAANARLDRDP
jgi:peptidoglycan/xylan/chitin deacetylase (PgdA/CDA1 family)